MRTRTRAQLLAATIALASSALASCAPPASTQPPGYPAPGQWQQQPAPGQWQQQPPQGQWQQQPAPGQWQQQPQPAPWWPPQSGWVPPNIAWPSLPGFPGLPGAPGVPGVTPPSQAGGAAQLCVDGINRRRATQNLPPLARWSAGEACASGEAQSDAAARRPHGSFGRCGEMAQNVCPDWPGPPEQMIDRCLQMMWDEGPGADFNQHGHYLNMASPRFTQVACGFWVGPSGNVWAVQDFQ